MKPLSTSQVVLSWISALTADAKTSKWRRILFKIVPLILIAGNLTGLASSMVFFLRYVSNDLERSLYALFQIDDQLRMTNAAVVTFLSRHKLQAMFKNLKNIYNARKSKRKSL